MSMPEIVESYLENEESETKLNKNNETKEKLLITEPTGIPNIEAKLSKYIRKQLRNIEKRKPKDLGSIFDKKKIIIKKRKKFGNTGFINEATKKYLNKEKDKYNVFATEDNAIKELMTQFKDQNKKGKISKIKRKKMAFNTLYDISYESAEKIRNLKRSKKIYSLEKYQENMLMALEANLLDHNEMMKLKQNLLELKAESNKVNILPPINVNSIRNHIINNRKKEAKNKNMKEIINSKKEPLDEYEKEMKMIKNNRYHRSQPKIKGNKNLEMLPEYIQNLFSKK